MDGHETKLVKRAPEKFYWPFPAETSRYRRTWNCASATASTAVGVVSRIWLLKFNNVKIYAGKTLFEAVEKRPPDTALITVSNHMCCLDDPLLWGCLKWKTLFQPSKLRWTLAAHDICFTNKIYGRFFALGKVVPVVRGEGVYQRGVDFVLDKLNNGEWMHIFPEGRINVEKKWIRLKWGVGRLVCECQRQVMVLPFYHVGMDDVLPNTKPYIPRFGKAVTILVGDPMDFESHLAKWRALGWSAEKIRKEITDTIQNELDKLRERAEVLHEKRFSS